MEVKKTDVIAYTSIYRFAAMWKIFINWNHPWNFSSYKNKEKSIGFHGIYIFWAAVRKYTFVRELWEEVQLRLIVYILTYDSVYFRINLKICNVQLEKIQFLFFKNKKYKTWFFSKDRVSKLSLKMENIQKISKTFLYFVKDITKRLWLMDLIEVEDTNTTHCVFLKYNLISSTF